MKFIKRKLKKIKNKILYGHAASSDDCIKYFRKIGMRIGEGTTIFDPRNTLIDETRPWLIEIGKNVQITYGVTMLTHGYDWSVLKGKYGDVLGSAGKIKIGDNVFIGVNTTILKGVSIGSNVIIGAGSLVNKDIPCNSIAVGNPARVICSLDEYYKKRVGAQENEAIELVKEYRKVYNENPGEREMAEFFGYLVEKMMIIIAYPKNMFIK